MNDGTAYSAARSLGHVVNLGAARYGDRTFLRFAQGDSLSFAGVKDASDRLASVLRRRGVGYGERVAVMLPNNQTFPLTWLALAKCGAVIVPLNPAYGADDLDHVMTDSGAIFVISDVSSLAEAESRNCQFRSEVSVLSWDLPAAQQGVGASLAEELSHAIADFAIDPRIDRSTLLNLQYTSGTTGFPKGCMLTHGYWLELAERSAELAEVRDDDVIYTCQPFFYMDPQWNVAMCLACGVPLFVDRKFSASGFWDTIKNEGVTQFYCIGTMPLLLYKQPPRPEVERGHKLRLVYCSGIHPDMHAAFEERWGVPWREVFGMTETGVDLAMRVSDHDSVGSGSVGRPVAGKSVRIVDADGQNCGPGTPGELIVRGTPMMLGYWNRPDETANTIRDGWLHTGDIAVQSPDASVRLVGRLKDMMRRGGENIAAAQVEAALAAYESVVQVAVVAAMDGDLGEVPHAFIRFKELPVDELAALRDVHQHATSRLARFKVPRYWTVVDTFPLTPSERIAKHRLAEVPWSTLAVHDLAAPTRGASAASTAKSDLSVTNDGAVMTVRIRRPERLNALRRKTFDELHAAFDRAERDSTVRVVVLTGEGRAFSAGADLDEMSNVLTGTPPDRTMVEHRMQHVQSLTERIAQSSKITVAAINGVAVGYGSEIPLAFDIRVASTEARIAFPESRRALCQTNGSFFFLPRLVGYGVAKHLLLSGETLDAAEALRVGLVTRVFDAKDFDQSVAHMTIELAERAPISVKYIKRAWLESDRQAWQELLALETEGIVEAMQSRDLREGVHAFLEKRTPKFEGS